MQDFFVCGSSAPVRAEREGAAATWLAGTLEAPSVPGYGLPLLQELWAYHLWAFFQASCSWRSEGIFGQSFSVAPPVQALRGLPSTPLFLCFCPLAYFPSFLIIKYSVD